MTHDRRTFLKAGLGATLMSGLRATGRVVLTRIIPACERAVPRMRINLLRFVR